MNRIVGLSAVALALCGLTSVLPARSRGDDKPKEEPKVITTKSGLKYVELKEGTGKEAKSGDTVEVHYTGWFKDGKKFDSSSGGKPLKFTIGAKPRQVIEGWVEGITSMKEGGKRKLIIPPALAYGERGHPAGIPPNAELTFEVELVTVK